MDDVLKWIVAFLGGGAGYKVLDVIIKGWQKSRNDDAANKLKDKEAEWKQREAEWDRLKLEKEAELTRYKADKEAHLARVDRELERVNTEHSEDRKNVALLHDKLLVSELAKGELRNENAALKLELASLKEKGGQC